MVNKRILVGLGIILVVAAIAFGYWSYQKSRKTSEADAIQQAGQGFLPSINPQSNPMENVPDTNPVSKTNPFSSLKTNPF